VTLAPVVPNEVILPQIGQQQLTCRNFDMSSEFRVLLATETNNNTTAQFATQEIHLTTVV
jgi:RecA/RadA recombinase